MPISGTTDGASTPSERHEAHIRALLEELERVELAGKEDRAKAIRAELGQVAVEAETPAKRAQKRVLEPQVRD